MSDTNDIENGRVIDNFLNGVGTDDLDDVQLDNRVVQLFAMLDSLLRRELELCLNIRLAMLSYKRGDFATFQRAVRVAFEIQYGNIVWLFLFMVGVYISISFGPWAVIFFMVAYLLIPLDRNIVLNRTS